MDSTPHVTLLQAARDGDRAALDALVRLYQARVYRFGLRVCRDAVDTEDAVQEAFVTLSREVSRLREETSVGTWLLTVVKNACLRLMRPFASARKALGSLVDEPEALDLPDPAPTPEEAVSREQVVRGVREAIELLEPPYREVLVLRDIEGLSGPEVARTMGLTLEAMKTRLHRARLAVREHLLAGIPDAAPSKD
ncbi:RNA polymerase sigma factor [Pyxidicoccus sp. MSG2]|uniref:RNA polymerase sigma factor n=1 Tax=Pyxidicoccus sp. MSG2 TaxID=2996790 RepID=UPI00226D625B|nr:sigma-70 family RNA polymerase sigma factor [Pyxidicoccus sp. MSG2]MCY1019792.1 sigma-70 family RNA polymerase sigma factor [Pyxidicoccus sp. MSG2]